MSISSFSAVLGLSEAARGYGGGSDVDYYPGMSLSEATGAFSNYLTQWSIDQQSAVQKYNARVSELMVESVRYGAPIDMDVIIDEAAGNVLEKIKKFFARIKEWIKSIINKLRMFIDKIFMSGQKLVGKYEALVKKKNLKGMTFTGYKFAKNIAGEFKSETDNLESDKKLLEALKVATGNNNLVDIGSFESTYESLEEKDSNADAAKALIKSISDTSEDKKYDNLMKKLTSLSKGDGWKAALNKKFFGGAEKVELKYSDSAGYGDGGTSFGRNAVISALKDPEDFNDIVESYDTLEDTIKSNEDAITTAVEDLKSRTEETRDYSGDDGDSNNKRRGAESAVSYADAYVNAIGVIYKVLGDIRDAKVQAVKQRNAQARAIFSKMISYKEEKSNSDFSDDAVELFGFDGFGDSF